MTTKIYKILGKRGRITIPFELRIKHNFAFNDVVSFEEQKDGSIVIRKEKLCNHCNIPAAEPKETSLLEVLNSLNPSEQKAAFRFLAAKLAESGAI